MIQVTIFWWLPLFLELRVLILIFSNKNYVWTVDCIMNSMVVILSNFELNFTLWNFLKLSGVVHGSCFLVQVGHGLKSQPTNAIVAHLERSDPRSSK